MFKSLILWLLYVSLRLGASELIRSDGYTYNQRANGFFKLHASPEKWHDARLKCHDEGAILASPLTYKHMQAIEEILLNFDRDEIFSGVHATFVKGLFYSVDGIPLKKMKAISWTSTIHEGNLDRLEDCLVFLINGTMADRSCNATLPFICYAETPVCGIFEGYNLEDRSGSCYKFHTQAAQWHDAYETCHKEEAHLAIVNSDIEALVLKDIFAKYPMEIINSSYTDVAAIGFHNWNHHASWWTIHGQTLAEAGYSNWDTSQPDSKSAGGGIFRDGTLDDLDIEFKVAFICEKKPNLKNDCICDCDNMNIF